MEKVDYKHGKFNILTTIVNDEGFDYADYVDWCKVNHRKPCGEDSGDFQCWKEDETQTNYEDDMDNIKTCKQYNIPVLITGTVGRWNGNFEILPVHKDSVADAIKRCIGSDDLDVEVFFDDGKIEFYGHHHDATNHFTIRALSKKGYDKVTRAMDSMRDLHLEDYTDKDFKRLPYLYAI